jgi:hypothetical protein
MIQRYNGSDRRLTYLFDNANHVEVDPIQTAGNPVADITIDGETKRLYAPPGGSGADVEANPSGTPTADLDTIRIGQVIYDIPGSGGGSGSDLYLSDYYSEDERVVGRWTDGKPIYQRVMDFDKTGNVYDWTLLDDSISYDKLIFASSFAVASNESNDQTMSFQDRDAIPRFAVRNDHKLYYYIQNFTNIQSAKVVIQYTKTTDAAGTGPTSGNLIYLPALYSEEEREVGVWTDGKPVYQKSIPFNNESTQDLSIEVTSLNIDRLVNNEISSGVMNPRNQGGSAYMDGSDYLNMYLEYTTAGAAVYVHVRRGSSWSKCPNGYVTIRYTKTTDQPGSGTWTPDGQLAHHYSTSEKVVGTWIDGSTVYERVITLTADLITNNSTWTDVQYANSMTNIDHLISCQHLDSTQTYLMDRYAVQNGKLSAASVNSGTVVHAGDMYIIRYTKTI